MDDADKIKMDTILVVIGLLLVITITGFVTGQLPYPFGLLVLIILFVARLHYLRNRKH